MPELPEVETTRRGIEPHVLGKVIERVLVRQPRLRWPVPEGLSGCLAGQVIGAVRRRAKYLLLQVGEGELLIHLGMSGSLRVVSAGQPAGKHDHVDLCLQGGVVLRLNDPRRFGAVLWCERPGEHRLLAQLGPEPLSEAFDGEWLYAASRGRRIAVKAFIMEQRVVVGVGNIYANEALFEAGIDPRRAAGAVSLARYQRLVTAIRRILVQAIEKGGTTLKDFVGSDGRPGYFAQELRVYGRGGDACLACGATLKTARLGQRAAVYCPVCQR